MEKTISNKILKILIKSENKGKNAIFNFNIAKKKFKNKKSYCVEHTIMRTARRMVANGLLKRTSTGQFILTKKGKKRIL